MQMIYLSHPFTGNENYNRVSVNIIAANLAEMYPNIVFFNPLDAMRHEETANLNYSVTLCHTLIILSKCDGIVMLDDWKNSRGCMCEYHFAIKNHIRVYHNLDMFMALNPAPTKADKNAFLANTDIYISVYVG